jgi:hypothetical protein
LAPPPGAPPSSAMLFNISRAMGAMHRILAGNRQWALFGALLVALVAQRCLVLDRFAFRYTDHDQVLMWYAATEYAHLRVHEPRFYGQNYNTMLEAAFAAPLVLGGVPHAQALPIVTSFLALSPFVLVGVFALRRGLLFTGIASLALPLTLPLRFHLVTSMPRGFVTGGFVACLAALVGLRSATPAGAFLFGLLSAGSISILPNALVLVIPVCVYVGLEKRGQAAWSMAAVLGAALAGLLHTAVQYFYVTHPAASFLSGDEEGVLTSLLGAQAITRVSSGLSAPGRFLSDVLPTLLGGSVGAAAAILAPPLLLWRARSYSGALASLAGGLCLVVALGLKKVQAGSDSIFYPWSRHFLPLPIALVLYLLWWEMGRRDPAGERVRTGLAVALVLCAAGVVAAERRSIDEVVPKEVAVVQRHVIPARTDVVYRDCRLLEIDVRTTHASIVVFPLSSNLPLNYACPAVLEEPFSTLCPEYDRRAWLFETELARRPRQLLLYDYDWSVAERAMKRFTDVKFMRTRPSVLLVGADDQSLAEVLRGLRIKVRAH